MQNPEHMQHISHSELHCLQAISECGEISPYVNYDPVLGRLIELRLIEKVSQIWLPLEMMHDSYQLTHLGHQVLSKSGAL
jgi:hypothetical protein